MSRLAEAQPQSVSQLTLQYRMNEDICQLSNDIVYAGKLKCANDTVRVQRLSAPQYPENVPDASPIAPKDWLAEVISPESPVCFVDTDRPCRNDPTKNIESLERKSARRGPMGDGSACGSIVNDVEADLVKEVIEGILACGVSPNNVGIICPFRAQVRLLNDKPSLKHAQTQGLEVSTIDKYQGRDKQVIVVSFVRSNVKGRVGRLLEDFRRLNVAVTRAKSKLILIGSFSTLHTGSEKLRPALDSLQRKNCIIPMIIR